MEQRFLRLTLSPTIRRHQFRLPAIVTAPADQTQQPCNNYFPTTMAEAETQQDFHLLTLSPTVLKHQLRLHPIKTRPSHPTPFEQPRSFVDELHEFPLPEAEFPLPEAETKQDFHRLTLSPTVLQHQLRLHPIKTRPSHPTPFEKTRGFVDELYEFPLPEAETQQDFHRLTLSPTVLQHQLRLHPIKTRPSHPTPFEQQLGFVDELYEFPLPEAETQQDFHRLTHSPTVLQHQLRLHPSHPTPSEKPRGFVDELYEFPPPASPMISFTDSDGKNHFHGFQDAPKAPPAWSPTKRNQLPKAIKAGAAARFEERFGDLSMPIRWRLVEACKSAMEELVDAVAKEMAAGLNANLMLPEDVCLWREVVEAAEAVGLDVEEPKRKG